MTLVFPDEMMLLEAANLAQCAHLRLISNGRVTKLSPIMLPGYHQLAVRVKPILSDFEVLDAADAAAVKTFLDVHKTEAFRPPHNQNGEG